MLFNVTLLPGFFSKYLLHSLKCFQLNRKRLNTYTGNKLLTISLIYGKNNNAVLFLPKRAEATILLKQSDNQPFPEYEPGSLYLKPVIDKPFDTGF